MILASFVAAARISPMLFASWMRILQAVDGAVLWLQGNATIGAQLRAEAARAGVDPHRLIFAARVAERSEHLARQAHADLFLDVFPYNAHSTARDALWAGVPVLTRRGQSFASRVAASLVSAAGLSELITTDLSQYENLAIRLASDPAQLAALKAQLADHRHQLFDTPYLVAELEKAYMTLLDS